MDETAGLRNNIIKMSQDGYSVREIQHILSSSYNQVSESTIRRTLKPESVLVGLKGPGHIDLPQEILNFIDEESTKNQLLTAAQISHLIYEKFSKYTKPIKKKNILYFIHLRLPVTQHW